jgi:hypothetical protein
MKLDLAEILFQIDQERSERALGQIVLLRNFEGLPFSKPGNDIDIIVREKELPGWHEALEASAGTLGMDIVVPYTDYYVKSFLLKNAGGETLKIDLNHAFNWRGVEFADLDCVLDSVELYSAPIYIASSTCDRAFVTFCHSFLYGGFINRKYLDEFTREICRNQLFFNRLKFIFGSGNAQRLADRILSRDIEMKPSEANALRIAAILRSTLRAPSQTMKGFTRSLQGPTKQTY